MPTAEKSQVIEQAKEWYGKSKGVVFADYRGLKVKEMQALRANLRAKGGEIHVIKNTLFRLAAGEDANALPDDLHNGPTAIAFVYENESDCAKALFDFTKTHKNLAVKGGFFGGKAMTAKEVETLSKLPPREVLLAQVIGTIAAPLTNLVGVIEALYADPIRTIGAVADKMNEGAPAPEPAAEAVPEAAAPEVTAEAAPVEAEAVAEPAAEAAPEPEAEPAAETAEEVAPATDESAAEAAPTESETPAEE